MAFGAYEDEFMIIYVPDDMLDSYKSGVLSNYAERLKPLSEYTE